MAAPDQSLATLADLPKSIEVDMRSQVNADNWKDVTDCRLYRDGQMVTFEFTGKTAKILATNQYYTVVPLSSLYTPGAIWAALGDVEPNGKLTTQASPIRLDVRPATQIPADTTVRIQASWRTRAAFPA